MITDVQEIIKLISLDIEAQNALLSGDVSVDAKYVWRISGMNNLLTKILCSEKNQEVVVVVAKKKKNKVIGFLDNVFNGFEKTVINKNNQ